MSHTRTDPACELSFDEFDEVHHPRPAETGFGALAEKALSRRGFLGGGAAFGAAAFVMSAGGLKPLSAAAAAPADRLGFEPVAANGLDTVTVPPGYRWQVVARWGDPMWSRSIEFDQATRGSGASQELAFGDNVDGMALFHHRGRNVLAVNNEYVNLDVFLRGLRRRRAAECRRRAQGQGRPRGVGGGGSRSGTGRGPSSRIRPGTAASPRTRPWRSPGPPAGTIS